MSQLKNKEIVLDSYPEGKIGLEHFRLEERELPPLKDGEYLVENQWLSLDPYVRPRLNAEAPSYVEAIKLGEMVQGETVGVVLESRNPRFKAGDQVFAVSGWARYWIGTDQMFITSVLPETDLEPSVFLGVAGTPGRAAYFGLDRIGKPKAGETLVISAASGAVGSVAGQLGKQAGCRVVGLAGSDEKCRYVVEELGFDACINYKTDDLGQALRESCPQGIDIYFENVGGRVSAFVARFLNEGARVPVCGVAANYDKRDCIDVSSQSSFFASLPEPPESRFFFVTDWFKDYPQATMVLLDAAQKGAIKFRETIAEGLESTPQAFIDMLHGKHFGKQLVRL
ncbi:NADPH-dependent curcumin reductase [Vibrio aerogenes CECT 7868]|uniref:NADPH-dependent curcumin reductase n=1 Tax=Vibrio aerogenes CECT 7868 TaxID=1216006 RepID=A0A1M5ZSW7_9VIBR|nr:NADP-dependent oxidoreductase [Vibrio aerogenes]SHI27395.1 NADPH-dependent curcumin reductase [Vibrio aerogenes CECT 7868]